MLGKFKIVMEVKSLLEIASFNVAKYLFSCYEHQNQFMRRKNCTTIRYEPLKIGNHLDQLYPCLYPSVRRWILHTVDLIGRELERRESYINDEITCFDHICWTPLFTIDKVKSSCKTKKFDITFETLCDCCLTTYVCDYRSSLTKKGQNRLQRYFGKYTDNVILYWYWYGRQYRTLSVYLDENTELYEHRAPIENVSQICVFLEYEVAVFYYWTKMNIDQQRRQLDSFKEVLLHSSDYLDFVKLDGLLPSHTFSFLWKQLDVHEQADAVHNCFLDFYRYNLYHEDGVELLLTLPHYWSPSGVTPLEYYRLLKMSIDTNNLCLFVLLWQQKLAILSHEQVGLLMWALLLNRDEDFKICTMIINNYNRQQKVEVLNELDKRIECANYDFNDRIDRFLSAASIENLRTNGFPRNPRPQPNHSHLRTSRRFHRLNWR